MRLIAVNDYDVDARHSYLSGVEQCILDKLLLDCHFETSFFLLKLSNYILHVLFYLILFFNFKSVAGIRSQLGMELVFLLADEHFQMVKLCWLQVALHLWYFVGDLALVSFDLD
jgi:hypothetical protein